MRGLLHTKRAGATGDLLLVASVVMLLPSWVGGTAVLSSVGLGTVPAAVVGGVYAWGRGGLSAVILLRRWRRGTLVLSASWLRDAREVAAAGCRMADYPTPAQTRLSLSTGVGAPAPV